MTDYCDIDVKDPGSDRWRCVMSGYITNYYIDMMREGHYAAVRITLRVECPTCGGAGTVKDRQRRRVLFARKVCPTCHDKASWLTVAVGEYTA